MVEPAPEPESEFSLIAAAVWMPGPRTFEADFLAALAHNTISAAQAGRLADNFETSRPRTPPQSLALGNCNIQSSRNLAYFCRLLLLDDRADLLVVLFQESFTTVVLHAVQLFHVFLIV